MGVQYVWARLYTPMVWAQFSVSHGYVAFEYQVSMVGVTYSALLGHVCRDGVVLRRLTL